MQREPSVFFLQGFTGIGLVGYLAVENLSKEYENQIEKLATFPDFFPRILTVEQGKMNLQSVRLERLQHDGDLLYLIYGPQPDNEIMLYHAAQTLLSIISQLNEETPIEVYLSFGAFMRDFEIPALENEKEVEKVSEEILRNEYSAKRIIRYAYSGLDPSILVKVKTEEFEVLPSEDGVISGLNGFLPAFVSEKLSIPAVSVMIETSIIRELQMANDPLSTYFGLCASRIGIKFINQVFRLDISTSRIENMIEKISHDAKEELQMLILQASKAKKLRDSGSTDTSQFL